MRISTTAIFDAGVARMNDMQSSLLKTQQQLSTGKRLLTPADDPVAASQVLDLSQGQAINGQMTANRQTANDSLTYEESVLQTTTGLLQDVKTSAVSAGNPSMSDADRKSLAIKLSGQLQQLIGLANSKDALGNYIFAGYNVTAQPFATTSTGATYVGDQGQRMVQVSPTQQMALSDTGDAIFQNIRTGNGSFVTAAASTVVNGVVTPTNTGSGLISPGTVVDGTALTGHDYSIAFHVTAGVTTYDVLDTTAATTVSAGNAYTSGQSIAFDGLQFDIQGDPADNDSFTVKPSSSQSIFTTVTNLINTLNTPAAGSTGQANLTNGLNSAETGLDNAIDNVLSVRASIGSRLNQIDSLNDLGSSRDIQYSQSISQLQDLDYTKAISDLNEQQIILQAAQKSFAQVSGLSLFNYI